MLASFIITLREGLEAGLIISMLLAYVDKAGRPGLRLNVYIGVLLALAASALVAVGFGEAYRKIGEAFEGVSALIAAGMLTYMIFWMAEKGKHMKGELESKAALALSGGSGMAIGTLAFISVFREGTETVLFLGGLAANRPEQVFYGTGLGLIAVFVLSFILFRTAHRLNIGKFFRYTGYLLLFFAAGMVGTGTLALQSVGWFPQTIAAWNTGAFLSQKTVIGNLFNALLGYTAQPSVLQAIFYFAYLAMVIYMFSPAFKNQGVLSRDEKVATGKYNAGAGDDEPFMPLPVGGKGYDNRFYRLLRHPLVPKITRITMGIIFLFILIAAIVPLNIGPFNNHGPLQWGPFHYGGDENNLFNFTVWVVWLPLVSLTAVIFSRLLWCGNLCPLGLASDLSRNLADRLFGKSRNAKPYMRLAWFLPVSFVIITLIYKVPNSPDGLQPYARPSAIIFIGIFAAAMLVGFIFKRGTWCRYFCPIGGWLSRISRMGLFAVRSNRDVCATCIDKPCIKGTEKAERCPTFLNPSSIDSNRYCLGCGNCIKNCPKEKAALKVGMRFPGVELQKPYAAEPGEALLIAGLMGMYVAAARQGIIFARYNFGLVMVGLILAGMAIYLGISFLIAWSGNAAWKDVFNKIGYALLPLELATAILAFGDDMMSFLGITVPLASILLGAGFIGSLILSASILKNIIPDRRRWGFAFSIVSAALILVLSMWLKWYAGGHVIDLT